MGAEVEVDMVGKTFVPTRKPEPVPGARILGLQWNDELRVADHISNGFPPSVVGQLARALDMTEARVLGVVGIPESAYRSRKRDRRPLSSEASSRIYRIAKAAAAAIAYFEGNSVAARRWLDNPKPALGGKLPLEIARTPEGSDYVIRLLNRMEHGIIG